MRSVPYSKIFHDYHREALAKILKQHGIYYVYLGKELGPRSEDDAHYDKSGQVQFDRLLTSTLYQQGSARLMEGINKGLTIALMCAEKDPADCHRSLMIGYDLQRRLDVIVQHIDHVGNVEFQNEMELRLQTEHATGNDLFSTTEEQIELACQVQCRLKAYRKSG